MHTRAYLECEQLVADIPQMKFTLSDVIFITPSRKKHHTANSNARLYSAASSRSSKL